FALYSRLVAPCGGRGGRIRACDNGRGAVARSCTAQTERKKSDQSHSAPALQRFLLLASDPARTRTRFANSVLAQASCLCRTCRRKSARFALCQVNNIG